MSGEYIKITILSGAEDGKVYRFEKNPITLGRHPDDDVCLPDDKRVSRHHARITKEGGSYFIEDLGPQGKGSTNGTYVDQTKVTGKTLITTGQIVAIGTLWIRFEIRNITNR
jgi:pSer/pThr/pTyr-binding forkhead associated (FHA) protein